MIGAVASALLPDLDLLAEADRVSQTMRSATFEQLRRKGLVVAMSGGIDSSVCAALAVQAVGKERVLGLLLPERDSSGQSSRLARQLAEHLGIPYVVQDISETLEAIGCYRTQAEILARLFPGFGEGWRFKLAIHRAMGGRISLTRAIAVDPLGVRHEQRLASADYQAIVAATNFKQRVRKTIEYFHADRLNYAVVGTPNLLEYELGFFVKNGDGAADIKPIAHLYKTQVYSMARRLALPEEVTNTTPTTDTFSLSQGQDEFYFGLPYPIMDVAVFHYLSNRSAEELASAIDCSIEDAMGTYEEIGAKRRAASYLAAPPITVPRATS